MCVIPEVRKIQPNQIKGINTAKDTYKGKTFIRVKDIYKEENQFTAAYNIISFNSDSIDIELGRLEKHSKFYITAPYNKNSRWQRRDIIKQY